MELLYAANYLVYAIFLSLFVVEAGIALTSLIDYNEYKRKLRGYIMPMWELNGTFAVFYVVSFEATYPLLLPIIGTAYLVPALVAALLIIGRNVFIVASEFESELASEVTYSRVYAIATLAAVFVLSGILASAISGVGLSLSPASLNVAQALFSPFAITLFLSIALFALAIVTILFGVVSRGLPAWVLTLAAVALTLLWVLLFDPAVLAAAVANTFLLALIIILLLALMAVRYTRLERFKPIVLPAVMLLVFIFGILQYPNLVGGTVNETAYYTNQVLAPIIGWGTIIGCVALLIAFALMLRLARSK